MVKGTHRSDLAVELDGIGYRDGRWLRPSPQVRMGSHQSSYSVRFTTVWAGLEATVDIPRPALQTVPDQGRG